MQASSNCRAPSFSNNIIPAQINCLVIDARLKEDAVVNACCPDGSLIPKAFLYNTLPFSATRTVPLNRLVWYKSVRQESSFRSSPVTCAEAGKKKLIIIKDIRTFLIRKYFAKDKFFKGT